MQSERDWIKREMDIADTHIDTLMEQRQYISGQYDLFEERHGEPDEFLGTCLTELDAELVYWEGRLYDLRRQLTFY